MGTYVYPIYLKEKTYTPEGRVKWVTEDVPWFDCSGGGKDWTRFIFTDNTDELEWTSETSGGYEPTHPAWKYDYGDNDLYKRPVDIDAAIAWLRAKDEDHRWLPVLEEMKSRPDLYFEVT